MEAPAIGQMAMREYGAHAAPQATAMAKEQVRKGLSTLRTARVGGRMRELGGGNGRRFGNDGISSTLRRSPGARFGRDNPADSQ